MHFGIIEDLFSDPKGTLILFLLALPGRWLAISLHESAHAWVADRCGDPTARLQGRITLNPFKHLDPVGIFMMLFLGIGWAKPVPVNPRNYRNPRKDDLKVSMAGIVMNAILFLLGYILLAAFMALVLSKIPYRSLYWNATDAVFRTNYDGVSALFLASEPDSYYPLNDVIRYAYYVGELCVAPVFGNACRYLYEILYYFVQTNLVLAIFNLIPLPPLDGYHLFNDLFMKRNLFAKPQVQVACSAILYLLSFSGVLGEALGKVYEFVLGGFGNVLIALFQAVNLI